MYAGFLQAADHYDWLINENLLATKLEDPDEGQRILVTDAGRRWAAILTFGPTSPDGEMAVLTNGELVDFGDEFPAVLGIFDSAGRVGEEVFVQGYDADGNPL